VLNIYSDLQKLKQRKKMALGLYLSQRCEQRTSIRLSQRQSLSAELRQALALTIGLRQEFKKPSFPNAVRGLAGMIAADKILKEHNASGVLIGGVAEAIWNPARTESELSAHKDVDVLVFGNTRIKKFEGGIDWWMEDHADLTNVHLSDISTAANIHVVYFINGNGVVLTYRLKRAVTLLPGLHFLTPDCLIYIRYKECLASIDEARITIETDETAYLRELRKKLGLKQPIPSFMSSSFDPLPFPYYSSEGQRKFAITVESIPLATQAALRSFGDFIIGKN
jgi:hypothetical protein